MGAGNGIHGRDRAANRRRPGGCCAPKKQPENRCEISVTTPAENEIGNIKKCLSADFEFVVLIVPDEKHLPGLRKAVGGVLSETEAARVRYFTPDQLFAFVEELDAKDASKSETIRGYKVKVKHTVVDNASKADRKQMLAKIIGDSKKRKKD